MFKTILLTIGITASVILGYLLYNEYNDNANLQIDLNKYKRLYEFSDSLVTNRDAYLDSAYKYIENINYQLAQSEQENINIKEELADMQAAVDTISMDSIATYIISNFAGDTYYIHKVNDSTYISLQDITGRDIVKQDIAFKALNKLFKNVSNESDMKDSIIIKCIESLDIAINTGDNMKDLYDKSINDLIDRQTEIFKLQGELDRAKKIALGSIVVNGILIIGIILL
jgi:hypothetical protein